VIETYRSTTLSVHSTDPHDHGVATRRNVLDGVPPSLGELERLTGSVLLDDADRPRDP
jgi:hypothetical protein